MQALKARDHGHFLTFGKAFDDIGPVDGFDPGRAMRLGCQDRDLPALPGAGLNAHVLQRDRQQAGRDLLTGGDNSVVFAGVMQRGSIAAPADQFVGLAGHGRDNDGNLIAGIDLTFHVAGHISDAFDIGDRGATELHYQTGHDTFRNTFVFIFLPSSVRAYRSMQAGALSICWMQTSAPVQMEAIAIPIMTVA